MKLWLLEILACPIDHAFPLACTVLKWEEPSATMLASLLEAYSAGIFPDAAQKLMGGPHSETSLFEEDASDASEQSVTNAENRQFLVKGSQIEIKFDELGQMLLRDTLVLKFSPPKVYLDLILASIKELDPVVDKTAGVGPKILTTFQEDIKTTIERALSQLSSSSTETQQIFESIALPLELLNRYKNGCDVEDALLCCPTCGRWYPVYETIPTMLPDAVRNIDDDAAFKARWQSVVEFPEPCA